ncbi:MAG: ASKHA domain-containing protein, partial [Desulfobacteraceae bacterium]|nr:ASKHA domain-containing protein [Desulfobacteraceae bacterium]
VVEALNKLAADLCSETDVHPEEITEIVVAGNTAMHHLLLRLPVEQLALAPHVAAVRRALDIKARNIGLSLSKGAYIHLPPNIAGFVGGDHVSMLSAIDAWEKDGPLLAVDIGTNTEISLAVRGELTSISCASGPAFEGAHISCGMRAAAGAIDMVRIFKDEIEYHTIYGSPPAGLCGSGIFDALAQLYSNGIVDKSGQIKEGHSHVRSNGNSREFVLVPEEGKRAGRAVIITQKDVRELQLAKAAISAGIQVLLKRKGLSCDDLDQVIVAGAFGTYMNLESAVTIGMLPNIPLKRYRQVGNAAGAGAISSLISISRRTEVQSVAKEIQYLELAGTPEFNKIFLEALALG